MEPRRSNCLMELKKRVDYKSPSLETFPAEITLEILRNVLICSEKLAFTQMPKMGPAEAKEVARKYAKRPQARRLLFSRVLRLARHNHCQHGEPVAKALMANFSALCLVSESTRQITREIFFSENQWVLHTTRIFDAVDWVIKKWGMEALSMMRDVRIEVQSMNEKCFHALEAFVGAANKGGHLRTLSVQWLANSRGLQVAGFSGRTWHFHPMSREFGCERNRLRGRGLVTAKVRAEANVRAQDYGDGTDYEPDEDDDGDDDCNERYLGPQSEPSAWAKHEVALLPLKDLRGLIDARIEGTVREKWAVWLEECMTSRVGHSVSEFEFDAKGLKAIEVLKGRAVEGESDSD